VLAAAIARADEAWQPRRHPLVPANDNAQVKKSADPGRGERDGMKRYFDPLTLQWTSADPAYRTVPDMDLGAPQRLNLYSFTLNNPLAFIDANGLGALAAEYYSYSNFGANRWDVDEGSPGMTTTGKRMSLGRSAGLKDDDGSLSTFAREGAVSVGSDSENPVSYTFGLDHPSRNASGHDGKVVFYGDSEEIWDEGKQSPALSSEYTKVAGDGSPLYDRIEIDDQPSARDKEVLKGCGGGCTTFIANPDQMKVTAIVEIDRGVTTGAYSSRVAGTNMSGPLMKTPATTLAHEIGHIVAGGAGQWGAASKRAAVFYENLLRSVEGLPLRLNH
jgi:RHS repeat-associated protein